MRSYSVPTRPLPPPLVAPALFVATLLLTSLSADSTVVFNEVMYHPLERERDLEWVELHNQMAVDMDISGWSLGDGVSFGFPAGTIVPGGGYLVVAISPDALRDQVPGGVEVLGPFAGRLSNEGESIALYSGDGRQMDRLDYGVGGDWPVAADGSGASLAKLRSQASSAVAGSWDSSVAVGGTPGAANASDDSRPLVAFNETQVGADGPRWLELVNHGDTPVDLAGSALTSHGAASGEFVFDGVTLAPGAYRVLDETELGFELRDGSRLFFYDASRLRVVTAVRLRDGLRGRFPDAVGRWLVPERATPAGANDVRLSDDVVINEIMYHQKARVDRPARFEDAVVLPVAAAWRYDASGRGHPGPAWRQSDFDDREWPASEALFYRESVPLPGPKNTELPLGIATYYFRARFEAPPLDDQVELALRPVIDDGAVFYLNGVEIHRLNMREGEVTPDSLARIGVSNATFSGPFPVPSGVLVEGVNTLAVEVHQSRVSSNDVVFGLELVARRLVSPAESFRESPEAWVELYNRGVSTIDLSHWRLAGGIRYEFPPGTSIGAGRYLVIAKDRVALGLRYPGISIVGDFEGRLSNRGELLRLEDDRGNPADEVHYRDDGRWPSAADGGGSSLELRDPRADNRRGEAWAASDETQKTEWQTYSFRSVTKPDFGPSQWSEFVFGLLDAGEVLLDDVRVFELLDGDARDLIQNGDFEAGTTSWRLLGTHGASAVVEDPHDPGNHVLHVVATGPTGHMHNHVETTLADGARALTGRAYEVSFRARWLSGSNQLHTRLYFNRIPSTTALTVPDDTGTPGTRNSAHVMNLGPTFEDLSHRPVVPAPDEPVTIRVRVDDPDGVAACRLFSSVAGEGLVSTPMALARDEAFEARLPGRSARQVVQFYVEAEDGRGVRSTYPAGGPRSRALYRVDDGAPRSELVPTLRLAMTPRDVELLRRDTNVMSNALVGCTVIYDDTEVFYDVGVRLKGSERGRPNDVRRGFNVRLHREHLFRGVHHSIHVDRPVGPQKFGQRIRLDEILFKHMAAHAGGVPSMYDDVVDFVGPWDAVSDTALLSMARFTKVYLDSRYENGGDGSLWEYELIYYPTTTTGGVEGLKRPVPDQVIGVDLEDLGDDKEVYRWNWLVKNQRARDSFEGILRLCKAFGLEGAEREARTAEVIDIDQWLRTFALISLAGVRDIYTYGLEHNVYFYQRPSDGLLEVFPLDTDHAFFAASSTPLLGNRNFGEVCRRPRNLRVFYAHIRDLARSTFNAEYMARWVEHYGELTDETFDPILGYIDQRSRFALAQLPDPVPFAVTTNDGAPLTTAEPTVEISGTAGIDVREIVLQGRETQPEMSFPTVTTWTTTVALAPGENEVAFAGLDAEGDIIDVADILVMRTSGLSAQFVRGDLSLDGRIDIIDPIQLLLALFSGRPIPCEDAGDFDDNEMLQVTDGILSLELLFLDGPPPPSPYPEPGSDPGGGALGCERGLEIND